MAEMKGIKLCGECGNYDWKKHKCKIGCNDDSNAQASFYGDCPLPDVVLKHNLEMSEHLLKGAHKRIEELDKLCGDLQKTRDEIAKQIFEEFEKIIDNEYNKHIFGNNDLDDIEHDAIINFSDDISSDLEELKKKYKVCSGNCLECDGAIWETPTSYVGDNRIIGCKWKESEK